MEPLLHWLTAIAALIGVWLNIKKHVLCFWIWVVTNAVWVHADLSHGIHAQAALQAVYFLLSIYGIWKWSREKLAPTREVSHEGKGAAGQPGSSR